MWVKCKRDTKRVTKSVFYVLNKEVTQKSAIRHIFYKCCAFLSLSVNYKKILNKKVHFINLDKCKALKKHEYPLYRESFNYQAYYRRPFHIGKVWKS